MEIGAKLRNAPVSPQKCRLVADQIRGVPVEQALQTLSFSRKSESRFAPTDLAALIDKTIELAANDYSLKKA